MTYKEALETLRYEIEEEGHCSYIEDEMQVAFKALEKQIQKKPVHIHEEYPKHQWQCDKDGEVDLWAWSHQCCNGPVCERCGEVVCENCNPDYDEEECIVDEHYCPSCNKKLYKSLNKKYCDDCGQALDWEE